MFLDSDFNEGGWGNFEGDSYNNYANAMGRNKKKNINNIINDKVVLKPLSGNPLRDNRKFMADKIKVTSNYKIEADRLKKQLKETDDNLGRVIEQLKIAQEQNKNMMMYGLLGIIAIVVLTKK
ncbi:hypothetical protein OAD75_06065 [Gammaproteobacteria bacterium]|nr:hypothetical protein [Gammaproteobacteria bacterium]